LISKTDTNRCHTIRLDKLNKLEHLSDNIRPVGLLKIKPITNQDQQRFVDHFSLKVEVQPIVNDLCISCSHKCSEINAIISQLVSIATSD
jgi:hypothetical protein